MLGCFHPMDTLPVESNSDPYGMGTGASLNDEQIRALMPCAIASVLEPTSGEPHCGRGIHQSSRVPEATSQMLSQDSSGTSRGHNTSSAMPSGQGGSAPGISIPSDTSQSPIISPAHTRNEGIDQIEGEALLEEVVPQKGPTTGGIHICLWGQNFPTVPIFVRFGDNCVRAVSYARYHYPF